MLESEAARARVVCIGTLSSNVDRYWTPVRQHDPGPQEVHHHIRRSLTQNLVSKRPASGKKNLVVSWTWLWPTPMSHPNWKWTWCKFSPPSSLDGQLWVELWPWIHVELESKLARLTKLVRKLQRMSSKQEKTSSQSPYILSPTQYSLPYPWQCELTTSLPKPTLILDKGAGQGRVVSSPYTDLLRWGREA